MSDSEPAGHRLFARYAYAPNALGYCGPGGSQELPAVACGRSSGVDVRGLAEQFSGAWPYQQVLAELAGVDDPLDERVVRAYWTGNDITAGVDRVKFGQRLLERIEPQAGHYWGHLGTDLLAEAAPTHAFHVFGVYPWSRLLGSGRPEPLHVLDSCRIRWATVLQVDTERVQIRSQRLRFDGHGLSLGPEQDEPVRYRLESGTFVDGLVPGDDVAVHWDFVCDRLSSGQVDSLRHWTHWQLDATNARVSTKAG